MSTPIRSTNLKAESSLKKGSGPKRQNVVLVCEDNAARQHALRSQAGLGLEDAKPKDKSAGWWLFEQLSVKAHAGEAAAKAAAADLVVFSVSTTGDLPGHVKLWIEMWIANRKDREGALVCLVSHPHSPAYLASLKEIYLRHTAHRAGMDYLSEIPSASGKALPDSPDSCCERARHVSSVLDEILRAGPNQQFVSRI
jgi:hypothetical protein